MQIMAVWSLGSFCPLHSFQPFGLSWLVRSLVYLDHLGTLYRLGYLCYSCWLEYLSQIGHLLLQIGNLDYWMLIYITWLPFTCLIICAKWLHYVDWVIFSSLSFKQMYHLRLPEFEAFYKWVQLNCLRISTIAWILMVRYFYDCLICLITCTRRQKWVNTLR